MNTIVFVEDDAEVGALIAAYLAKHDMQVTVEPRGDRAEETILRENPDLVLLDIMLPGKDGMTICRDLRAKWSGPIVLLTSLDSDMNHILALEMGACDYILKTTPPAVLLARLRLHLRQNEQATVTKGIQETSLTPYKALHFGTLTIDPINRVVSLANTEISLSTADFELLWDCRSGRSVHFFATYPTQPLRAGSWSCSLSLLPPSDAIAGYRPDRFYCHFPRLSGVYLDASALAGYVKTGSSGATIWRWASQ